MAGLVKGLVERIRKWKAAIHLLESAQYDMEYIQYCVEQEQTVSKLEASLHESDDPNEIAQKTLKTACEFYGAEWVGILDVDLELDVWTPLWWYNPKAYDKTKQLFGEFELAKFMPNWVKALNDGTPVIITDTKPVQYEHPNEYEVYKRLGVESVIGCPFAPNPVGFLAIKNPTRYQTHSSALNIFAYVIHRAMAQQKTIDSAKLTLSPDEIKSDRDIIINFFGSMSIYTSRGVLHERDLNSPKSSRVATFLMLNRKSAFSPLEIVSTLWPESEDKWETTATYIRNYIRKFREAFSLVSPYKLIVTTANGYQINKDFNIMTDLQQFDLLWEQVQHAATVPHKVELLKRAADLYKGPVFENACDELWIVSTVNHYKLRYIGIINELLITLDQVEDFTNLQKYAAKAVELTPENVMAHYWLIHSMNHLGTLELAKNEIAHAKAVLTDEEFESLKKQVAMDNTMPYNALFADK